MKPKQARRIARQMHLARSFAKLTAGANYSAEIAKRRVIIEKMVAESGGSITDAAFGLVLSIRLNRPKNSKTEQNYILAAAVEMIEPSEGGK